MANATPPSTLSPNTKPPNATRPTVENTSQKTATQRGGHTNDIGWRLRRAEIAR